jgi:hypothetical protein
MRVCGHFLKCSFDYVFLQVWLVYCTRACIHSHAKLRCNLEEQINHYITSSINRNRNRNSVMVCLVIASVCKSGSLSLFVCHSDKNASVGCMFLSDSWWQVPSNASIFFTCCTQYERAISVSCDWIAVIWSSMRSKRNLQYRKILIYTSHGETWPFQTLKHDEWSSVTIAKTCGCNQFWRSIFDAQLNDNLYQKIRL